MTAATHLGALVCVLAIAGGQILFKLVAGALHDGGTSLRLETLALLAVALVLYAAATLLWLVVLQYAPLSRAYPYMALSFVLVPAAGWFLFREELAGGQLLGIGRILAGVVLSVGAPGLRSGGS